MTRGRRWEVDKGSRCDTIVRETMHILHVVGARLNFVKAAPVMRALERWRDVRQTLRSFDRTVPCWTRG